jgi:hypothetical protein
VPLFDLKFLNVGAATDAGTSSRRHWPRIREANVKSKAPLVLMILMIC